MESLSSKYEFRIRWEPYLLRPQTPPEGLPIPAQYKDPSNPRVQHLRDVAASLGLHFNPNRTVFASTLLGHTLLEYAKIVDGGEKQDTVAEKLFKRCFADCDDLQEESLLQVAEEVGLDKQAVQAYLHNKENVKEALKKASSWSERGISGVPTFYINGQKMFSGAQEPEVFKRMFEVATERFPVDPPTSKS